MSKQDATSILEASIIGDSGAFWQGAIVDAHTMIRTINSESRKCTQELKKAIILLEELRDSGARVPAIKVEGRKHRLRVIHTEARADL